MKPKKLNIHEMWELYLNLKPGLVGDEKQYLLDEVFDILDKISKQEFVRSLRLFYPKDLPQKNPIEMALIFVRGLKSNSFFVFTDFIKGINDNSTRG